MMHEPAHVVIDGVNWHQKQRQWATTLKKRSGGVRTEFHDCLLNAVASRLRFEKEYWIDGGVKAIICALEQENMSLRERINDLELKITTNAYAGWQIH